VEVRLLLKRCLVHSNWMIRDDGSCRRYWRCNEAFSGLCIVFLNKQVRRVLRRFERRMGYRIWWRSLIERKTFNLLFDIWVLEGVM